MPSLVNFANNISITDPDYQQIRNLKTEIKRQGRNQNISSITSHFTACAEYNSILSSSKRSYANTVLASHNYEFLPQEQEKSGITLYSELLTENSNWQERKNVIRTLFCKYLIPPFTS